MSNIVQSVAMHTHWKNLIGLTGLYEGADEASCLFKFDNIVWEAIIDKYDGYRSCVDYVVYGSAEGFIAQRNLASVVVEKYDVDDFEGYILKDINTNHVWLKIGTEYFDEYYPCAIFKHYPLSR